MRRSAFTLVEVLLAVALSALLLAALYFALALYMDGMQSGRGHIEQAAVVRSLFNRLSDDVASSLTLVDPARFRLLAEARAEAEAQGGAMGAPGAAGGSGAAGGGTSGNGSGNRGTTGSSGQASGAGGASSGAGTGTGSNATPGSGASGSAGSGNNNEAAGDPDQMAAPVTNLIPLGVMGDATTLHLYITKMPHEAFRGALTSDLRRVTYWLGQNGLCRHEEGVVLNPEALTPAIPAVDERACLLAPEVIGVSFRYFDGVAGWQEAWDSSAVGPDEVTPIGPPRAIEVILTVQPPPRRGLPVPPPLTYRHVIAIATANGPTMNTGGGLLP